jgi:hypothetical protein
VPAALLRRLLITGPACDRDLPIAAHSLRAYSVSLDQQFGRLAHDPVVAEAIRSAIRVALRRHAHVDVSNCPTAASRPITYADLVTFGTTLSGLADGEDLLAANVAAADGPEFSTFLLVFYNNYYRGKFFDRAGNKVAQPTSDKELTILAYPILRGYCLKQCLIMF